MSSYSDNQLASNFIKNVVFENVRNLSTRIDSLHIYLSYFSEHKDLSDFYYLLSPDLYRTEDFLVRFKSKCVTFFKTSDPKDGSFLVIYQLSRDLHFAANVFIWVAQGKLEGHVTLALAYKNFEDAKNFIKENEDLVKTDSVPNGGLLFKTV